MISPCRFCTSSPWSSLGPGFRFCLEKHPRSSSHAAGGEYLDILVWMNGVMPLAARRASERWVDTFRSLHPCPVGLPTSQFASQMPYPSCCINIFKAVTCLLVSQESICKLCGLVFCPSCQLSGLDFTAKHHGAACASCEKKHRADKQKQIVSSELQRGKTARGPIGNVEQRCAASRSVVSGLDFFSENVRGRGAADSNSRSRLCDRLQQVDGHRTSMAVQRGSKTDRVPLQDLTWSRGLNAHQSSAHSRDITNGSFLLEPARKDDAFVSLQKSSHAPGRNSGQASGTASAPFTHGLGHVPRSTEALLGCRPISSLTRAEFDHLFESVSRCSDMRLISHQTERRVYELVALQDSRLARAYAAFCQQDGGDMHAFSESLTAIGRQ